MNNNNAWEIGKRYIIRTTHMVNIGNLVVVTPLEIVLEDAYWVADSDRFYDVLIGMRKLRVADPFPNGKVIIGRNSVIDAIQNDE
jgi:hypothetical protein